MASRFSGGTVELISGKESKSSVFSLPRVLAVLTTIFLITTVIFAVFYGIEKGKRTSDTVVTTASPVPPITTGVTTSATAKTTTPESTTTTQGVVTTTATVEPVTTTTAGAVSTTTTVTAETVTTTTAGAITTTTTNAQQDLCLTPYCIKAADYLIESIDETVDPCEDFFHFACGTWIKNNRIPDDAGAQNTFNQLRNQLDYNVVDILSTPPSSPTTEPNAVINARLLYKSCINETGIEGEGVDSILALVDAEFGGWPILQGPSWDESKFNLSNLILALRSYNYNFVFRIGTAPNEKNSSAYDIEVGQGDIALGQKNYYMNDSTVNMAYRQFMRDLAKALANENSTTIDQDVADIYEFEQTLAMYHWTTAEQRGRDNETVRTTLGELTNVVNTAFDFDSYLRRAYGLANVTLVNEDVVAVSELEFLRNASLIFKEAKPRTIQNYLVWRFMMIRAANMPQYLRILRERFDRVFRGTTAEPPRTVVCGNYVNNNMGFAVSKLYIKQYFDETARNQSFDMIGNIRSAFIEMLNESTWMDDASKMKAIEKAVAIDQNIGYPDYLASDNVTQLEEQYAEYVFTTSYIGNVLKLLQIRAREDFRALREPVDRKAWSDTAPSVVNAFYDPSKNQITFPAGILQKPFFDKDAPKYLNYGGIGVVIGHEITHGFDDTGRQFDKEGNRIPWWTEETIAKFVERKTCIVEQYSNYTVPQINVKSIGNQTQGEDIADNGGLRESYFAYEKWAKNNGNSDKRLPGLQKYSPEQMFFVNYAHVWCSKMTDEYALNRVLTDVHSIGQFRAIGPPSNFDQFDRAFGCTPGQGNSRKQKCIVW